MDALAPESHTTESAPQINRDMTPYYSRLGGAGYPTFREASSSDIRALQCEIDALRGIPTCTIAT